MVCRNNPKVVILPVIIFFIIGVKISALEINLNYNLFKVYNGFSVSENETPYEFTANIINIDIMNEDTGLGIDFSPIRYFYSSHTNILSFVNLYLYWDIFRIINPYNYGTVVLQSPELGPFFSFNWINIDDIAPFNVNRIIYSAGLKFSMGIRWPTNHRFINSHTYIDIEAGYRNTYGRHGFFLSVQFNVLEFWAVAIIGA